MGHAPPVHDRTAGLTESKGVSSFESGSALIASLTVEMKMQDSLARDIPFWRWRAVAVQTSFHSNETRTRKSHPECAPLGQRTACKWSVRVAALLAILESAHNTACLRPRGKRGPHTSLSSYRQYL